MFTGNQSRSIQFGDSTVQQHFSSLKLPQLYRETRSSPPSSSPTEEARVKYIAPNIFQSQSSRCTGVSNPVQLPLSSSAVGRGSRGNPSCTGDPWSSRWKFGEITAIKTRAMLPVAVTQCELWLITSSQTIPLEWIKEASCLRLGR